MKTDLETNSDDVVYLLSADTINSIIAKSHFHNAIYFCGNKNRGAEKL